MKLDNISFFEKSDTPLLIAGPCSAESEEQLLAVAHALKDRGVALFRAGVWKPRTRPGCFEGMGKPALQWLKRVKEECGMPLTVEVATAQHVEQALEAGIDVLWVGARTVTNPFAVQEVADALKGVDIPVLVKNSVNPDLDLWIGAIERLYNAGVTRLGAIHRGFSSYAEKYFRNAPQWQIPLELRRRMPGIPLICDPSHIAGKRELIMSLSQQALDLSFDGIMVETHCNPVCALSDARQQVTPDELFMIFDKLVRRSSVSDGGCFASYRSRMDSIDEQIMELLSKRMEISREMGVVKRENGYTVFQPSRYNDTMERCAAYCNGKNLDVEAVKSIFEAIHSESIRQQLRIVNEGNEHGNV